ncbi:hypothetical protein EON65_33545, partial [archaeon]
PSIVANALSERENHRTDTQYEDSMIAKIFIFQFVNSYASFFYLAFIAQFVGTSRHIHTHMHNHTHTQTHTHPSIPIPLFIRTYTYTYMHTYSFS